MKENEYEGTGQSDSHHALSRRGFLKGAAATGALAVASAVLAGCSSPNKTDSTPASDKEDSAKDLVHAVCTNTEFWGKDLTEIPGFEAEVAAIVENIEAHGTYEEMKNCLN